MFKRLLLLLVLLVTGLGGYTLGQRPDSPDLFGWADRSYKKATAAGKVISGAGTDEAGDLTVNVGGKTYTLTKDVDPNAGKDK